MTQKEYVRGPRPVIAAKPGPRKGVLPAPLPAGQIPPDDSRLWMFVPKAISAGERWVQDDTREWFANLGGVVQVRRDYPTHPRWLVGAAGNTLRGAVMNEGIVSEIHLLVRITAGLPDMPSWVAARLSLKQTQADLSYRLTKLARGTLITQGPTAMKDWAERSPGQFLKWIGATFVPKQIEQNVTLSAGQSLEPEVAQAVIDAIAAEVERRAEEAQKLAVNPTDYEGGPVIDNLQAAADELAGAVGDRVGIARTLVPGAARRLRHVIDLEADVVEVQPAVEAGEIEWD